MPTPTMSETTQLNRIQNFYGGISSNDKDKAVGVCSNIEEIDIFANSDYMEPNTIFGADTTISGQVTGYTNGDMNDITAGGTAYALSRDTANPAKAVLWRKTSADSVSPSAWASVKTSAYNSNALSPIAWHRISVPITSITLSGTTATITTTNNHGLTTSNVVAITVAGADQAGYNGTFKGAVTGANTITYTTTAGLASPATTLLAGGITLSYAFLFYVTGTNQLVRAEVTDSTSGAQFSESITDIAGTSMSLFGLGLANDRITFNRYNGELFIGSGRYICKIGTDGVVVPAAFVLPNGWRAISLAPYAHNMAILAGSVIPGNNYSKVFYWDLENTSGFIDESVITTGGPQIIVNFNESLWAICAINNILQVYKMSDKLPVQMQRLVNIATETATQAIIPDATKFVKDNAFYFGLWKTDKTGLYAIGQVDSGKPYGLVLAKRFHFPTISSIVRGGTGNLTATVTTSTAHGLTTGDDIIVTGATNPIYNGTFRVVSGSNVTLIYTLPSDPGANETTAPSITSKSYSLHKPYAAISIGENWYSSFDNNGTASVAKGEGASQVRSSQAVYETIWIDGNSPETPKSWDGFLIGTKIVPANCQIVVDTKVDNASTYDSNSVYSLTPSNDQSDDGITGDTFWFRDWTSVYGRMGKIRLRFISSTTTKATVYFLSFLSRLGVTF